MPHDAQSPDNHATSPPSVTGRPLSFQERLAAEAAFAGRPCNPDWSQAAHAVYRGMCQALGRTVTEPPRRSAETTADRLDRMLEVSQRTSQGPSLRPIATKGDMPLNSAAAQPSQTDSSGSGCADDDIPCTREDAIQSGGLIEMTPLAARLGVPYAVGMTRPAWDVVVTASHLVPEVAYEGRARDILLALRLRLMTGSVHRAVIDFPALLSFPPDSVPQPQLLLAAFHDSPDAPPSITLLLPREFSLLLHDRKDP